MPLDVNKAKWILIYGFIAVVTLKTGKITVTIFQSQKCPNLSVSDGRYKHDTRMDKQYKQYTDPIYPMMFVLQLWSMLHVLYSPAEESAMQILDNV